MDEMGLLPGLGFEVLDRFADFRLVAGCNVDFSVMIEEGLYKWLFEKS